MGREAGEAGGEAGLRPREARGTRPASRVWTRVAPGRQRRTAYRLGGGGAREAVTDVRGEASRHERRAQCRLARQRRRAGLPGVKPGP